MSEHSLLSASSSDRWTACPISVTADTAGGSSRAAAEGTMLHAICEGLLTGGSYPKTGSKHHFDGYDFEFTEDMQRDCEVYVNYIRDLPWVGQYYAESKVYYSRALQVPRALAFGTTDCRGFTQDAEGRTLEIIDLKMGRKPVSPQDNPQAILYTAGVLEELLEAGILLPQTHRVRVTIVQPRLSYKPFQWLTTVGHIEQSYMAMRPPAQAAVRFHMGTATVEDTQQFPEVPGSHCGYCRRKLQCAAFKTLAARATPAEGQIVQWDSNTFKNRDLIRAYLDDLEQLAEDSALAGKPLVGTKLVYGRAGNPKLRLPEPEIREVAKALGIEAQVVAVKEVWATPAKVRDAFKKTGMAPADIAKYIETPEAKPKITDASDPRAEYHSGVGSAFTGVPQI